MRNTFEQIPEPEFEEHVLYVLVLVGNLVTAGPSFPKPGEDRFVMLIDTPRVSLRKFSDILSK